MASTLRRKRLKNTELSTTDHKLPDTVKEYIQPAEKYSLSAENTKPEILPELKPTDILPTDSHSVSLDNLFSTLPTLNDLFLKFLDPKKKPREMEALIRAYQIRNRDSYQDLEKRLKEAKREKTVKKEVFDLICYTLITDRPNVHLLCPYFQELEHLSGQESCSFASSEEWLLLRTAIRDKLDLIRKNEEEERAEVSKAENQREYKSMIKGLIVHLNKQEDIHKFTNDQRTKASFKTLKHLMLLRYGNSTKIDDFAMLCYVLFTNDIRSLYGYSSRIKKTLKYENISIELGIEKQEWKSLQRTVKATLAAVEYSEKYEGKVKKRKKSSEKDLKRLPFFVKILTILPLPQFIKNLAKPLVKRSVKNNLAFENSLALNPENMSSALLNGLNLSGAYLRGANLENANLRHADLSQANLSLAVLKGADLTDAILTGAKLARVNLAGVKFNSTRLRRMDLEGAIYHEEDLKGIIFVDEEGAHISNLIPDASKEGRFSGDQSEQESSSKPLSAKEIKEAPDLIIKKIIAGEEKIELIEKYQKLLEYAVLEEKLTAGSAKGKYSHENLAIESDLQNLIYYIFLADNIGKLNQYVPAINRLIRQKRSPVSSLNNESWEVLKIAIEKKLAEVKKNEKLCRKAIITKENRSAYSSMLAAIMHFKQQPRELYQFISESRNTLAFKALENFFIQYDGNYKVDGLALLCYLFFTNDINKLSQCKKEIEKLLKQKNPSGQSGLNKSDWDSLKPGIQATLAGLKYSTNKNLDAIKSAALQGFVNLAGVKGIGSSSANFESASLKRINLNGAALKRVNFKNANLEGANLGQADLQGAYLTNASLVGANLENADLSSADLSGSDLTNTNLTGTDLRKANLKGAKLKRADLINAIYDEDALQGVIFVAENEPIPEEKVTVTVAPTDIHGDALQTEKEIFEPIKEPAQQIQPEAMKKTASISSQPQQAKIPLVEHAEKRFRQFLQETSAHAQSLFNYKLTENKMLQYSKKNAESMIVAPLHQENWINLCKVDITARKLSFENFTQEKFNAGAAEKITAMCFIFDFFAIRNPVTKNASIGFIEISPELELFIVNALVEWLKNSNHRLSQLPANAASKQIITQLIARGVNQIQLPEQEGSKAIVHESLPFEHQRCGNAEKSKYQEEDKIRTLRPQA